MAIRHIVMFRWADEVTERQVADLEKLLAELPGKIPELLSYQYGGDLGINEGNYDYAITAEMADEPAFVVYRDHPDHQVVKDVIGGMAAARAAVQFGIDRA